MLPEKVSLAKRMSWPWKTDSTPLKLARVLVVTGDPTSRLALRTVLEAGGYDVQAAASAAEAIGKLEDEEYELVLSDLEMECPEAGLRVLEQARLVKYQPAMALLMTDVQGPAEHRQESDALLVQPQNVPELLSRVAELISIRAMRQVERLLQQPAPLIPAY